jgi:hypothetical protein
MFHAVIQNESGQPFRVSGQVVPYDLQVLREHVLARAGRRTRVEVRFPPALRPALERALRDLVRHGVDLVLQA